MALSKPAGARSRAGRAALLLAAALALAAPLWLPLIGMALVVADPLAPADVVVPLGGDTGGRVRYAVDLLAAGHAPRMLITDMQPGPEGSLVSKDHAAWALAHGVPAERLIYGDRHVSSTYTELLAVRELAAHHGWRRVIVVTSPQHTRRTRIIADTVFATSPGAVVVRPVVGYGYAPARWWRQRDERRLTLSEYPKLLAFLVGYRGT